MSANAPSNASSTGSNLLLKTSSTFGKEHVLDRKRKVILEFPGIQTTAGPAMLSSIGTGTAVLEDPASAFIASLFCDTDTDSHGFMLHLPDDMDTAEDIYFRALWSQGDAAATGSELWIITYKEIIVGTTAMAVAATALSTAIADQVDLGAEILTHSEEWAPNTAPSSGILDGSTLTGTPGDDKVNMLVAHDETTITDANLYAIEMEYGRKYV